MRNEETEINIIPDFPISKTTFQDIDILSHGLRLHFSTLTRRHLARSHRRDSAGHECPKDERSRNFNS